MSVLMESSSPLPSRVTRAIALNAALWTAGNVLTTGGFLSYFATDLGARGFNLALLLAVPELVGLTGLASRGLVQWVGDRRKVWLITTLIARAITFLLPCVGLTRQWFSPEAAPWMLVAILVITQAAQGVATTLYFSWLADLVPRQEWGRLFARRNLAALTVQLVLPLLAAWFRDEAKRRLDAEWLWWAYAAVFTTGALLLLASVWPMWTVPHPSGSNARPVFEAGALRVLLQNPSRVPRQLSRRSLFWHYPHYHPGGATPYSAARFGDWRLVEFFETGKLELYNLRHDIGEKTDLSAKEPERTAKLHGRLKAWRESVGAQLPTPNPDHNPEKDKPSPKKKN